MKYLLDTHTAIWALEENPKLSENAKAILADRTLPLCISIISAWEIAIKVSTGKLEYEGGSKAFLRKLLNHEVEVISIKNLHVNRVEILPFIHRDPFDRLLVATALVENMVILTADENIQKYDVSWQW